MMTLFAIVGIGALTIMLIDSKKLTTSIAIRSAADKDVDRAIAMIESLILAPDSCNANFYGKSATSGSLSGSINKCSSGGGNCRPDTPVPVLDLNTFTMFRSEKDAKAQIVSAIYLITTPQTTGAVHKPAVLTLTVKFKKNLGLINEVIATSVKEYTFQALVVTGSFNSTTDVFTPSSTILGCAKNPASTFVY